MKNFYLIIFVVFFSIINSFSQQEAALVKETDWLQIWTDFNPNSTSYNEPSQIISGEITEDTKLYKRETYLLVGNVFVKEGTTLSIEPGTVIMGDYKTKATLTIAKGAQLIAEGTETDPIVFTSNKSIKRGGDWGGLILLGDGKLNTFGMATMMRYYSNLEPKFYSLVNYGGASTIKNSGILKYVRIEYAGKKSYSSTGSLSGLLLAGIGNETTIEHVMVSYSAGDSFKILGGNVNLKNVVSYKASANDFSFNTGTLSKINNAIAFRYPYASSSAGSRCLTVKSYNKREEIDFSKEGTQVIAENLKFINNSDNVKSDMTSGLIKEAVYIGDHTKVELSNSEIKGFKPAIVFDEKINTEVENLKNISLTNMVFKDCEGYVKTFNNLTNTRLDDWYANRTFLNAFSINNEPAVLIADAKKVAIEKELAEKEAAKMRNVAIPFELIEIAPVLPGCEGNSQSKACFKNKVRAHISSNFKYPEEAIKNKLQGRVIIMFDVDNKGVVENIRTKGAHKILNDEAERIIKLLPKMQPAKKQGQIVKMVYGLPIGFNNTDN